MDEHFHDKQQREWRGARGPYRDDRYNGTGITRTVILRLIQSLGVVFNRTLTFALDALGTATHGAMLYRGASVWQILAPNASPLPLITQGVGAAPVWTPLPLASLGNDAAVHGSVLFHNGTQWTELAPSTAGRVLTTNDVGADPTWGAVTGGSTPTGTGFRHVTAGAEDAAAKLVDTADINDAQVTLAKLANLTGPTAIGRESGTGVPVALTTAQITLALVNVFTDLLKGAVPASGGGTSNFLRADGSWVAPPGGGGGSATTVEVNLGATAAFTGKFTITDAAIGATSKVLVWQAPGPYTGKGTRADEAEMQPVQVVSVTPSAGSAIVRWQTPPAFVSSPIPRAGGQPASAIVPGLKDPQAAAAFTLRRVGLVRGNVKFSYMVLT